MNQLQGLLTWNIYMNQPLGLWGSDRCCSEGLNCDALLCPGASLCSCKIWDRGAGSTEHGWAGSKWGLLGTGLHQGYTRVTPGNVGEQLCSELLLLAGGSDSFLELPQKSVLMLFAAVFYWKTGLLIIEMQELKSWEFGTKFDLTA